MKKISMFIIILGILFCSVGLYFSLSESDKMEAKRFIEEKEKKELLTFLSKRYNETFEYVSKDYKYCLIQTEDNINNVKLDKNCNKNEIINEIYRVKNKDGIIFYVKKVTHDDKVNLLSSLIDTESTGYYDNYKILYLVNKYSDALIEKFDFLDNIQEKKIYYGLGIEKESSMPYQSINREMQVSFNKNDLISEFLNKANHYGLSFDIGFYIKINKNINKSNFQEILKNFADKNIYDFGNGVVGSNILIEFNNKRFIKIKDGYLATLYEYNKDILEENPKKLYDNSILLNNDAFSDEGITLNKFLNKKQSIFKF